MAGIAAQPLTRLALLVSNAQPGQLPQHFAQDFPDNKIGALARKLEEAMGRIADFIEREQHFTRDASHELRTPLAVIEGAVQMVQTVATLLSLAREELDISVAEPVAAEPVALLPLVEDAIGIAIDSAPGGGTRARLSWAE